MFVLCYVVRFQEEFHSFDVVRHRVVLRVELWQLPFTIISLPLLDVGVSRTRRQCSVLSNKRVSLLTKRYNTTHWSTQDMYIHNNYVINHVLDTSILPHIQVVIVVSYWLPLLPLLQVTGTSN